MEWKQDDCLLLIKSYESHTLLWDLKDPNRCNKILKANAWDEIAKTVGCLPEDCKNKMISLLSSHRRERARIKNSEVGKESSWYAYKALQFLNSRNITKTSIKFKPNNQETFKQEEFEEENSDQESRSLSPLSEPSHKRPRPMDSTQQQSFASSNDTEDDDCSTYSLFIKSKLRNYSKRTRNIVQFSISQILFNADQGLYEQQNVGNVSIV